MNLPETLAEIARAIDSIDSWTMIKDANLYQRGARAWKAISPSGWSILIASWPIEMGNGGTTKWGYDGTATLGATIVRLTPELAERAALKAKGNS